MSEQNRCNLEPCAFVKGLEKEQDGMTKWMAKMEEKFDKALQAALTRPGWTTTFIISILSSAVVGLLVALATMKGRL